MRTDVFIHYGRDAGFQCTGSGEKTVQSKATRTSIGRAMCPECWKVFPSLNVGEKSPPHKEGRGEGGY